MERDSIYFNGITICWDFNSHAHVERDKYLVFPSPVAIISTHTLTWSVTVIDPEIKYEELNFNSHAHVERDAGNDSRLGVLGRFQLTRSRGA